MAKRIVVLFFCLFCFYIGNVYSQYNDAVQVASQVSCYSRLDMSTQSNQFESGTSIINPEFSISGSNWNADVALKIVQDSFSQPLIVFKRAQLLLDHQSWQYKMGIGYKDVDSCLYFANTAYFSPPIQPETVFNDEYMEPSQELFFVIVYRRAPFKLQLTSTPFEPIYPIQGRTASLFQTRFIQNPYEFFNFGVTNPYSLSDIVWSYLPEKHSNFWNPSFELSLSYEDSPIRSKLFLFYGPDRSPALTNQLVFSATASTYTLYRTYTANRIGALGINFEYAGDYDKMYSNVSFVYNRLFATKSVYLITPGDWQETAMIPQLQYTIGFVKTFADTGWSLRSEYRNSVYFHSDETIEYPFLHRALFASLDWEMVQQKIKNSINYLYSLQDGSSVAGDAITINFNPQYSCTLKIMIPGGSHKSELGQYNIHNTIMGGFYVTLTPNQL